MEGVEDIPGAALAEGMTWNWESFPEYLDEVERMPRVLDVAALLPHGALRAYVLGQGRANDPASPDEIDHMTKLARQAIEAGAIGRLGDARAHREIDADGLLVTPGWVDIHTHYDGQVTWDAEVSPSGWHGVTTIVMGNCGVGFAPAR